VGVNFLGFALLITVFFFCAPWPRNALVAELDTLQKLAEGCNIEVPMEVVK
jgi:hypothetical protein